MRCGKPLDPLLNSQYSTTSLVFRSVALGEGLKLTKQHHLADLQLAIMQVVWKRGEATVAEVREDLGPQRGLAYTTVATMLSKMEKKGVVAHRADGRTYVYRALIQRRQVRGSMVGDLVDRLFAGDAAELVCHLLEAGEIEPEELARVKAMINRKEKERAR